MQESWCPTSVSHLSIFPKKTELGCDRLASELEKIPRRQTLYAVRGGNPSYQVNEKTQPASPGQSDIVTVIFAPVPALSRVHGKVQGQQLMLCICQWDHSWGGKKHVTKEAPQEERKATEHRQILQKRGKNHPMGLKLQSFLDSYI